MTAPISSRVIALIGAGPSLDYCDREIETLIAGKAHFFLSDSVAAGFLRKWRPANTTIFTVELRRHQYLRRIDGATEFSVLAYAKAHQRNLRFTKKRVVSHFKLLNESGDLPALYSPGTVMGTMISCAVAILNSGADAEIHLFGADLFYIDNQVYSRYVEQHAPLASRVFSREFWQYEMALKKSSGAIGRSGFAIRTSFELMQSRENMRAFVSQVTRSIRFIEYSPLGLDCERVEKQVPRA